MRTVEPWILTRSGGKWHFDDPRVEDVNIQDIAEGISKEPRFSGQGEDNYSVAQHCILVSNLVPPGFELEGLLHDAHEAYYKDISTPLKMLIPDYQKLELRGAAVIRRAFSVPEVCTPEVQHADHIALLMERRELLPPHRDWPIGDVILPRARVRAQPWAMSKMLFLRRFHELYQARRAA